MAKPEQGTLSRGNSAAERLDAVENAMWHIAEAMEYLKGFTELSDEFDACDEMYDTLMSDYSALEVESAGEYTETVAELTRDYYRDVM